MHALSCLSRDRMKLFRLQQCIVWLLTPYGISGARACPLLNARLGGWVHGASTLESRHLSALRQIYCLLTCMWAHLSSTIQLHRTSHLLQVHVMRAAEPGIRYPFHAASKQVAPQDPQKNVEPSPRHSGCGVSAKNNTGCYASRCQPP